MPDQNAPVVGKLPDVPETDLQRRAAIFDLEHQVAAEQAEPLDRAAVSEHPMQDKPYQASRTLGVLSKMMNLAEA